ncbi:MAG: homoserine O-acetyltransferase [Bacteroidales bacterium]|nr:homoserine O-acetyltransferase [Bacteroidales bacterium]
MIADKITLDHPFEFEAGGRLDSLEIVFHKSFDEYDGTRKVVWICHALTANSNPEDWWPQMVGPGMLFDTEKYFVVCVNILASPYGSSGPASVNPATGTPYLFSFPAVTVRDIIRTFIEVRKHLGIDSIDLLIGSSIGGYQACEWAVMEPDVIRKLVLMATDVRVTPWVTAWCEAQRMALEADPTFREAADISGGREGLKCARAQALISYRSFEGYCKTQYEEDPDTLFATRACSYERYQGEKLARRFDAYSYMYICNVLDSHNVGRNRGGVDAALATIKADTTLIAIDSDYLFPARQMEVIATKIPGARLYTISSDFGHDGFLLESARLREIIAPLLG